MCRSLHNFSDEFMCEKVDMLGEDKEDKFEHWGRRPECVAGKCSNCGFGNPNGIPTDCLLSVARHIEWWDGSVSRIKRWRTARRIRSSSYRRSDRCVTFGTSSWSTPRSTSSTMNWRSGSARPTTCAWGRSARASRVDWHIWYFQVVPVRGGRGGTARESGCLCRCADSRRPSRSKR
ncbi:unnamed protein product, partial [Pylaiella littoralis]